MFLVEQAQQQLALSVGSVAWAGQVEVGLEVWMWAWHLPEHFPTAGGVSVTP